MKKTAEPQGAGTSKQPEEIKARIWAKATLRYSYRSRRINPSVEASGAPKTSDERLGLVGHGLKAKRTARTHGSITLAYVPVTSVIAFSMWNRPVPAARVRPVSQ